MIFVSSLEGPKSSQKYKEPTEGSSSRTWEKKREFRLLNSLKQAGQNQFYSRTTKASHRKHTRPTLGKPVYALLSAIWRSQGKGGGRAHSPSVLPRAQSRGPWGYASGHGHTAVSKLSTVQAGVYTPCSFYHTNVFWLESGQGHFIQTPATQQQVNLPAQGSVFSFGPRGLNFLKSHHSAVKLETRECPCYEHLPSVPLSMTMLKINKSTDPHLLCEKLV